jgi:hypothetical protein
MYPDRLAQAGDVVFGGLTADVDATGKLDPETIGVAVVRASDRRPQNASRLRILE